TRPATGRTPLPRIRRVRVWVSELGHPTMTIVFVNLARVKCGVAGPCGPAPAPLLPEAGVDVLLRADIKAGVDRILDLIALDQVLEDEHRAVSHLEGPLTDPIARQAVLELSHLHPDGVG